MRRELTHDEVKDIYIKELDYLDSICREAGLDYYLGYGSLMGAIRHNGFIPWDTDIDIFLPRETAEKIVGYVDGKRGYKIGYCEMVSKIHYPCRLYIEDTKTIVEGTDVGVSLDCFIMDYVGKKQFFFRKLIENVLLIKYDIVITNERGLWKNALIALAKVMTKMVKDEYLIDRIKKTNTEKDKAEYIIIPRKKPNNYSIFIAAWFKDAIDAVYEGKIYPIPSQFDRILTQIYGDYMTPCPEWRRQRKIKSRHRVFEKDEL